MNAKQINDRINAISSGKLAVADPGDELEHLYRKLSPNMDFTYTQENISAFYATNGWGCKWCGRLAAPCWFEISGDIYCESCTGILRADPGDITATLLPNCAELGIEATHFTEDDSRFGFEYAAQQRREFESLDILESHPC